MNESISLQTTKEKNGDSDFDDGSPRFCLQDEPNEEAGEQSYHEHDIYCNIQGVPKKITIRTESKPKLSAMGLNFTIDRAA